MNTTPQKTKTFKILLLNMGYSSGLNSSPFQYFFKFYKLAFPSSKQKQKIFNSLGEIILHQQPNITCLIEIESKHHIEHLTHQKHSFFDVAVKYGQKSILRKIPLLKDNSNGFISTEKHSFKKHYLKNGTKKLLYEIHITSELTLIFMHFSLSEKVRAKQFKEISEKFKYLQGKIICGDFNIFGGFHELDFLLADSELALSKSPATFPAYKPSKTLDLFLHSENIQTKIKVLSNEHLSDHLPVVLEITY